MKAYRNSSMLSRQQMISYESIILDDMLLKLHTKVIDIGYGQFRKEKKNLLMVVTKINRKNQITSQFILFETNNGNYSHSEGNHIRLDSPSISIHHSFIHIHTRSMFLWMTNQRNSLLFIWLSFFIIIVPTLWILPHTLYIFFITMIIIRTNSNTTLVIIKKVPIKLLLKGRLSTFTSNVATLKHISQIPTIIRCIHHCTLQWRGSLYRIGKSNPLVI